MLVAIAILGLIIGSFLNVVILRLHSGRQFVRGRSACPNCGRELRVIELTPVVSWLWQRGRCRNCGQAISLQYPIVEIATAFLFVLAYITNPPQTYGDLLTLLLWGYIIASFIVLAVYDLRWYLLPDKALLPLLIPAGAILVSQYALIGAPMVVLGPLAASAAFGGLFYLLARVSGGRWMGGGDVKLVFIIGLLLGLQKTALAMLIAFWSAAVIGIALILIKRKKRRDHIPFGPFLIVGTLTAYFYGAYLINWYLSFSGLNRLY